MAPNVDGCIIPDKKMLREDLIVSDVIYNPMETKLLRMAKEQGCQTFNGLYMLYTRELKLSKSGQEKICL